MNTPTIEDSDIPQGYAELIGALKTRIRHAQARVSLVVNRELILLYWEIGRAILDRQDREGWGTRVIDRLADDLAESFPTLKGFSSRNLKYMRKFAEAWPDRQVVQQAVAQIPWSHNLKILDALQDHAERLFYIRETARNGWTRSELALRIQSGLFNRQGQALHSFQRSLPEGQCKLAEEILKDPYLFDFLSLPPNTPERTLEKGLVSHLRDFLLELGVGFAFVGSQAPIVVDGEGYFLDLLFYHTRLRCYVVVEIKRGKFLPEHVGKLQFYLAAVDAQLRHPEDRPSIGMILCQSRNRTVVEYALRETAKPIGVSEYRFLETLPNHLINDLPTSQQLRKRLRERKSFGDAMGLPGEPSRHG